ncbi:MAG: hypothetical protein IJ325_12705, partial [Clostridia bacterium]|nr:hypothetical protein [Clostridia bacterium]
MFYKLMCQRSYQRYKKSYINILLVFILSLSMLSFVNIFCDSLYNYNEEVVVPILMADHTCDIRIKYIKESEVGLFYGVPNVEMEYRDGNLDFFLIDTEKFEETLRYIQIVFDGHKRFAEYIETHDNWDEAPWIYVYYGVDVHENIETTNTRRITTYVFQLLMLPLAVTAMIMIYNNYIKQRAEDIRTLVGIGISEQQLKKLFFIECNILYLISAVIGVITGGLLVWLNCLVCEFTDMSQTNAVYPVFHVDFLSLLVILLLGYAVVNITFLAGLKRILKMDASYTCADTVVEFKPDKSRFLYYRSKRSF